MEIENQMLAVFSSGVYAGSLCGSCLFHTPVWTIIHPGVIVQSKSSLLNCFQNINEMRRKTAMQPNAITAPIKLSYREVEYGT